MKKSFKTMLAAMGIMTAMTIPTMAYTVEKIPNVTLNFVESFVDVSEFYDVTLSESSNYFDIFEWECMKDPEYWKPGKKVTFKATLIPENGYMFSKTSTKIKVTRGKLIPNYTISPEKIEVTMNYYPKVQLAEPENIYYDEEFKVVWDKVEFAPAYEVRIKDSTTNKTKTVMVTKEEIDLSPYATDADITFEVRACAKDKDDAQYILASKWVDGDAEVFSSEDNTVFGNFQGKYDKYVFKTNEGKYATGFQYINGKWYYFDANNKNYAVQSSWKDIDGKWYYFNEYCVMQTGWIQVDGEQYYLNSDGIMKTGWHCNGPSGPWFYFDTTSGKMLKNTTTPDGYVLNAKGEWHSNNTASSTSNKTSNNKADKVVEADGWHGSGTSWYYTQKGKRVKGWLDVNGSWFYFDKNGDMLSGWQKIDNKWYYLNPANGSEYGKMLTGWLFIDGNWHYFTPYAGGPMGSMLTGTTTPDGYYVDANGIWKQ